ncbi:MAG: EamA family transporter [Ignavibacteriales bacterium]|nr:EamA family transporter [Ignavibacteriales bacterium]
MIYLIIVSIIWSLSFALIKGQLTSIDPFFVSFIRLLISFIIFLPFLRLKEINKKLIPHLLLIGAIQYGIMYLAYIYSYQYLQAFEIAILTIFTPIFIVIIIDVWNKNFISTNWIKAVLAIIGSAIIIYSDKITVGFWKGILLMQVSNFLFAFGQIYYKKIIKDESVKTQKQNFGIIFFGAVLVTAIFSLFSVDFNQISISLNQGLTLIYLGAVASGLSFFLWNVGATKVNEGNLAVFNNLKIPLGVLFSIIILSESVKILQLIIGFIILIVAFLYNSKKHK